VPGCGRRVYGAGSEMQMACTAATMRERLSTLCNGRARSIQSNSSTTSSSNSSSFGSTAHAASNFAATGARNGQSNMCLARWCLNDSIPVAETNLHPSDTSGHLTVQAFLVSLALLKLSIISTFFCFAPHGKLTSIKDPLAIQRSTAVLPRCTQSVWIRPHDLLLTLANALQQGQRLLHAAQVGLGCDRAAACWRGCSGAVEQASST
jgi:hypothetical protein